MGKRYELVVGEVFGRLTVLAEAEPDSRGLRRTRCLCFCGRELETRGADLRLGIPQSCGCLMREQLAKRNFKHGMTGSSEHRAWLAIFRRCYNPQDPGYKNYGGRGISVKPRWLKFSKFYSDMGPKPEGFSLERLNVNGPYCRSNCVWASSATQSRNKRNNNWVSFEGERLVLTDAAKKAGISPQAVNNRKRNGWPEEDWFKPAGYRRNKPTKETK